MNRFFQIFTMMLLTGCFAGCGGSSSTNATTNYALPIPLTNISLPSQMGGAFQKPTPLPLATTTATVNTFAGSTIGFTNNSTARLAAKFNHPISITTNGTDLYVADYYNNVIRKISTTGAPTPDKDASTIATGFNQPAAITMESTNLYIADSGNFVIKKIDLVTNAVTVLAGTAGTAGSLDAVGTAARFNQINGITTDGKYLYVSDSDDTIRTVDITSGAVTTLAGTPGKAGSDDGIQSAARFNQPANLTTDGTSLFVADFNNATIRRIVIATGKVTTLAGITGRHGMDDGPSTTATFFHPNGITTDGTYLYVTDYNDTSLPNPQYWSAIRKVEIATGKVTTIAGGISSTFPNSVDASGTSARFTNPVGITTDGLSLYVADSGNNTIRRIE